MNKARLLFSLSIGVIVGIYSFFSLAVFMIEDSCLDRGGIYDEENNLCSLLPGGGDDYFIVLSPASIVIGSLICVLIASIVMFGVNKLINKISSKV